MPPVADDKAYYTTVYYVGCKVAQRCDLCQRPACRFCTTSFETYLAHMGCLDIRVNVLSEKTTCEDIWKTGVLSKPWFMPPIGISQFKPSKHQLESLVSDLADEASGTKRMIQSVLALPHELFRTIVWEMAERSFVARVSLALQFNTDYMNQLKQRRSLSDSWFTSAEVRDYNFEFLGVQYQPFLKDSSCTTDDSVIRLGLDHLGIRSVELLNSHPRSRQRNRYPWYIVERVHHLQENFKLVSNVCREQ